VDEHHAAAADSAHLRIHHALNESAGHGSIHSVAATAHNVQPDLRRVRLWGDDYGHEGKGTLSAESR
jgi:hypothetical protein